MPCQLCFRVFKLIILSWKAFIQNNWLTQISHFCLSCSCWWQAYCPTPSFVWYINSRPPQPKYLFVWDFQEVLNFIKSTWGETDRLGEKELSLKLCMLLALTARSRASGIHHLDISLMVNAGDKVTFHFHKLQKSWRKGNPLPFLTVYAYSPDKQLCVVQTRNRYLEMTKDRRDPSRTQFLLSFRKP